MAMRPAWPSSPDSEPTIRMRMVKVSFPLSPTGRP
jgi:hypothetical protein